MPMYMYIFTLPWYVYNNVINIMCIYIYAELQLWLHSANTAMIIYLNIYKQDCSKV